MGLDACGDFQTDLIMSTRRCTAGGQVVARVPTRNQRRTSPSAPRTGQPGPIRQGQSTRPRHELRNDGCPRRRRRRRSVGTLLSPAFALFPSGSCNLLPKLSPIHSCRCPRATRLLPTRLARAVEMPSRRLARNHRSRLAETVDVRARAGILDRLAGKCPESGRERRRGAGTGAR